MDQVPAMKIELGEERVVLRGIRPEEQIWGPYQFPKAYKRDGRLIVVIHISHDEVKSWGAPRIWCESRDNGETWEKIENPIPAELIGIPLGNGDRLYFPNLCGIKLDDYKVPPRLMLTPDYEKFYEKTGRNEGYLPRYDGVTRWMNGAIIAGYHADRLSGWLSKKEFTIERIPAGETKPRVEKVPVDWPYLTRAVHQIGEEYFVEPLGPYCQDMAKTGPDGALWVWVACPLHINPQTGLFSPYFSVELFRSDDNGYTFRQRAHFEYEADGREYPYQSGGFVECDFEFMPDNSLVVFLRSTWAATTGIEWGPMYMSRSGDNGVTWSKPARFSDVGILPRLCKLDCGATLLSYARPGAYLCVSEDKSGRKWGKPFVLTEPADRSGSANVRIENPNFYEWEGTCYNNALIAIGDNKALLFYSDFYYPDENGIKRKTILCRTITVVRD